jgi:steroid delta-isomerase-like uncharacterized protein
MTDCAARALALFDSWEKRDYDTCMSFFASGMPVRDYPRGIVITEPPEIRDWLEAWATACPDSTGGVTVGAVSGDAAVLQGTYVGTNTGPFGPLPATGKSVSLPFAIVLRFNDTGLVSGYDVYYDQYTLLTQLGHIPTPG